MRARASGKMKKALPICQHFHIKIGPPGSPWSLSAGFSLYPGHRNASRNTKVFVPIDRYGTILYRVETGLQPEEHLSGEIPMNSANGITDYKPDIYEYLDYRRFLRDAYEAFKIRDRRFSHRHIARKVGSDAGGFYKIISGQRHIPHRLVMKFAEIFRLNKREQ